jgi:hypothetical protein
MGQKVWSVCLRNKPLIFLLFTLLILVLTTHLSTLRLR